MSLGAFFLANLASAEVFQYDDICEASAVIRIDDTHFAAASDELDRLAVYQFGVAKPVRWSKDLGKLSDIEAVAQVGNTTFWTTSHSLKKNGDAKAKRNKLFATITINRQPVEIGKKYKELTPRIVSALAAHSGISLSEGEVLAALNIEGLAATSAGELLIGLRAPLDNNGHAIVVNIGDPFALLGLPKADPASVQKPLAITFVELGGKGIRSFARIPDSEDYLIVGGASKSEEAEFELFKWNATSNSTTALPSEQLIAFGDASPEGMIVDPDGRVTLFGDNDKATCTDDEEDTRVKAFPSINFN
jgi:hypothetical protein